MRDADRRGHDGLGDPPATDPAGSPQGAIHDRERVAELNLRAEWQANASDWVAWAREPMHDSYWRFHRDRFTALLPPPGHRTVDIGSGEGRLSRDLQARGHRVLALDVSPTMAAAARAVDPSMAVVVAEAAALPLRRGSADLAVAFMSLQDIDDLHGALRETARVLRPGGYLCCAIVHPLNSAGGFRDHEPGSPFIIEGSYLQPSYCIDHVNRDGLRMTFASAHRPLETYVDALESAGFLVERLREPTVPDEAIQSASERRWQRVPLFLHLRAIRT